MRCRCGRDIGTGYRAFDAMRKHLQQQKQAREGFIAYHVGELNASELSLLPVFAVLGIDKTCCKMAIAGNVPIKGFLYKEERV